MSSRLHRLVLALGVLLVACTEPDAPGRLEISVTGLTAGRLAAITVTYILSANGSVYRIVKQ